MKKLTALLSFCILLTAFTCENEPLEGDFETLDTPITGSFTVDFDDQTYIADQVSAVILDDVINITAVRGSDEELITITIQETTVGTYDIGVLDTSTNLSNGAAYNSMNGSDDTWVAATDFIEPQGSITISEINETDLTMSGTFSFTAYNVDDESKAFTNGIFTNISYSSTLDTTNDNTFFANVDGQEFEEDLIFAVETSIVGFNSIGISATKNSGETIGFTLDAAITPGTYEFVSIPISPTDTVGLYNVSSTETYTANGTITIVTHNTTTNNLVATFEFVAEPALGSSGTGSFQITDGEFDVTY